MNIRLSLQLLLCTLISAVPLLCLTGYCLKQKQETSGAYSTLLKELNSCSTLENKVSKKPYQRRNVVKQIWFRPLEDGGSLYLQADQSELLIETIAGRIKAKERLHNVLAGFQDTFSFSKINPALPIALRTLRAGSAIFDYSRQLLDASEVDIELYHLARPIDLSWQPFPNISLASLAGHADRVRIDCQHRPPIFRARQFRATINPHATEKYQL